MSIITIITLNNFSRARRQLNKSFKIETKSDFNINYDFNSNYSYYVTEIINDTIILAITAAENAQQITN